MTTRIDNAGASLAADAIGNSLNGGSIEIRTGAQPANVDDAATGTLLGTITIQNPAFAAASNGVKQLNVPIETLAIAAGSAGYARFKTSGGTARIDASISEAGGGGDLIIDTATVAIDDTLRILSYSITMPKS